MVPAQWQTQVYAQWKPNYAYTYLFKISDNTSGWTSDLTDDPAGLYPITFDAIVLDSEDGTQSTITTVHTPAITTYQKGHVYNDGNPNDDYKTGKDIYVMVQDADLKDNLNTKGALYTIDASSATVDVSEATVMDALNIRVSGSATVNGRNGIALTNASSTSVTEILATDSPDGNAIPLTKKVTLSADPGDWPTNYYINATCETAVTGDYAAGTYYRMNTAVKFEPSAGTYAYAYEVSDGTPSYIYSAESSATKPTDWTTADTWYKDPNGLEAVADADFVADKIFYKRYTNLNKVYSVKVIRVKSGS